MNITKVVLLFKHDRQYVTGGKKSEFSSSGIMSSWESHMEYLVQVVRNVDINKRFQAN